MSSDTPNDAAKRRPRVFDVNDPKLEPVAVVAEPADAEGGVTPPPAPAPLGRADVVRGIRWGAILFAAATAAGGFALSLWFYRLVSVGLWREDWVGWVMRGLVGVAVLALVAILLRELVGWLRLGRLGRLKRDLAQVMKDGDLRTERAAVRRLVALYRGRADLRWARSRLADHGRDVHDAGGLLALADREMLGPLDAAAVRIVTQSAKRVATVTAISPMASLAVGYVLVRNLNQLRALATLYGGRPGVIGSLRLARLVVGHLIASGGMALTDDLLGQFIGQDLVRRLSKRLGEGAFNGALTARVGVAAIAVLRPLPHISTKPPRVRDILTEVFRRAADAEPATAAKT
ncbi:MAG: TIGR01620 family protein [Hyphomicrobiales bacterium]|nr:TIGR01620 family protein [Hyphomicrobiales bacterium]